MSSSLCSSMSQIPNEFISIFQNSLTCPSYKEPKDRFTNMLNNLFDMFPFALCAASRIMAADGAAIIPRHSHISRNSAASDAALPNTLPLFV